MHYCCQTGFLKICGYCFTFYLNLVTNPDFLFVKDKIYFVITYHHINLYMYAVVEKK